MSGLEVEVMNVLQEAERIKRFTLTPIGAGRLPAFSAGAHIDVYCGPDLVRQYSLCGPENDAPEHYVIAVKEELNSRGGSRFLHAAVSAGTTLTISSPRNNFQLVRDARKNILLAAGIGITPLHSMAHTLLAQNKEFSLHYFCSAESDAAFRDDLRRAAFDDQVRFHFLSGRPEVEQTITDVLMRSDRDSHIYVCGPSGFIDTVRSQASGFSWPADLIHVEHFSNDSPVSCATDEFVVRLARSGNEISVGKNQSIVAALAEQGVYIDTSCEQGVCGTCITDVIDGEIDHHDVILSAEDRASGHKIIPCVSRCKSGLLILDL